MIGYVQLAGDHIQCYDRFSSANALAVHHLIDSTIRHKEVGGHVDWSSQVRFLILVVWCPCHEIWGVGGK